MFIRLAVHESLVCMEGGLICVGLGWEQDGE